MQERPHKRARFRPSPQYWDNLSKIWLTDDALEELDRRNRAISRHSEGPSAASQQSLGTTPGDLADRCSPTKLLKIKELSQQGGPDLSDLRNFPDPSRADPDLERRSQDHDSDDSSITRATSSIYDGNFEQTLIEHGIYPDEHIYAGRTARPDNLDEINERLSQRRASLSPSRCIDNEFRRFKYRDAASRISSMNDVLHDIEGRTPDYRCMEYGLQFDGLAPLADDIQATAKPDCYFGACLEQLRPQLREELSDFILPSEESSLMVPNFFLQARKADRSFAVMSRQACYHGVLGARGIHKLRSYIHDNRKDNICDNKAYTITATYHGGHLRLCTVHPVIPGEGNWRPKDNELEYVMTQLNAWSMIGNAESFRQGLTAYRNARDWAKEQRNRVISDADGKYRAGQSCQIESVGDNEYIPQTVCPKQMVNST
ncbi:hypothetical protein MGYG_02564 [Nannizzia gypsea CBS 118893]|uniref:Uncharacterized protein n=1 Tax=Arthroderma gypseum (strain ATCC MYA-4604 / CBS 118893) TaxID=535722 RepID=E4UN90_ARTGP|nr:hypothetical protein MGYG_02564 [Nannizzia gypsea CBS 118893]EFQ99551.1 hypothetical protein MGYG_02564 [Nannizzia gypsea CBS 118893]